MCRPGDHHNGYARAYCAGGEASPYWPDSSTSPRRGPTMAALEPPPAGAT